MIPMIERVALSLNSDDLELMRGSCDLDKIIASGWAGRNNSLGCLAFWSKYVDDKRCRRELSQMLRKIAVNQTRRKMRGGSYHQLCEIADATLVYWLHDMCPTCRGLGYIVTYGETLTHEECQTCHGTKMRQLPGTEILEITMEEGRLHRTMTELLNTLENAMTSYVKATVAPLRHRY